MGAINSKITLKEFNERYHIVGEIGGETSVTINPNNEKMFEHEDIVVTEYKSYNIVDSVTNRTVVTLFINDEERLLDYICERFNIRLER